MLKVLDVLSLPVFKDFRLVTDNSGLYNEISDAKLYEDATESTIPEIYRKGVFIILSPSILLERPDNPNGIIMALIERQPSAICIKEVVFSSLRQELVDRANALHVPIFFFADVFLDEILYAVKNSLTPYEINTLNVNRLARILLENITESQIEYLAREINPLFYNNVICGFCIPKDQENLPNAAAALFEEYLHNSTPGQKAGKYAYSVLKWPRGISFIYTTGARQTNMRERLMEKISQSGIEPTQVSIGVSNPYHELRFMKKAFNEALYAAIDALLLQKQTRDYDQIGLIGFLAPFRNDEWTDTFYYNFLNPLDQYDKTNDSNLMQTLLAFVRNGGNIAKTAEATFQHSNTIRYRMDKIKTILGLQEAPDAEIQLYLFVRLHEMKKLLI